MPEAGRWQAGFCKQAAKLLGRGHRAGERQGDFFWRPGPSGAPNPGSRHRGFADSGFTPNKKGGPLGPPFVVLAESLD